MSSMISGIPLTGESLGRIALHQRVISAAASLVYEAMAERKHVVALMMGLVVVGAFAEKVSPPPITHVATTDIADMMNPGPDRRMELPGFDPEFVDFPHYIIRITERNLGPQWALFLA